MSSAFFLDRLEKNYDTWGNILKSHLILLIHDQIGDYGIIRREDKVKGIWGHSYVKTYFKWVDDPKARDPKIEGGIATSYFVLNSIKDILKQVESPLKDRMIENLFSFILKRVNTDGMGIATNKRGVYSLDVNLRHTSFGYLIINRLLELNCDAYQLIEYKSKLENILAQDFEPEFILKQIFSESWPVGGICAYLRALQELTYEGANTMSLKKFDYILNNFYSNIAKMNSSDIYTNRSLYINKSNFTEHFPYWHPIKNMNQLRLHSTLAAIELLGAGFIKNPNAIQRIKHIKEEICVDLEKQKGFKFSINSKPSIAAAFSILKILSINIGESSNIEGKAIEKTLDFIETNWDNSNVYHDYWSEFNAQIFTIDGMLNKLLSLNSLFINEAFDDAMKFDINPDKCICKEPFKQNLNHIEFLINAALY
jgi:hypothetical protein